MTASPTAHAREVRVRRSSRRSCWMRLIMVSRCSVDTGSLLQCPVEPGPELLLVERLPGAVALDDPGHHQLRAFERGETLRAGQAFPPPANLVAPGHQSGVDDLGVDRAAERAMHGWDCNGGVPPGSVGHCPNRAVPGMGLVPSRSQTVADMSIAGDHKGRPHGPSGSSLIIPNACAKRRHRDALRYPKSPRAGGSRLGRMARVKPCF